MLSGDHKDGKRMCCASSSQNIDNFWKPDTYTMQFGVKQSRRSRKKQAFGNASPAEAYESNDAMLAVYLQV
jgi:hypothetical protein